MAGYLSASFQRRSFLPSAAFFKHTASVIFFMGSFNFEKEKMMSFRILDLNPTSTDLSTVSKAFATLLKAEMRIASSWGVHCWIKPYQLKRYKRDILVTIPCRIAFCIDL
jgi:hypothetical protein